jgi:hypothetical protein
MAGKTIVAALAAFITTLTPQMAAAEDLEPSKVEFSFENLSGADVVNCTMMASISNFPAPELVNVRLRIDGSPSRDMMFFTITTDVGEQLYRDGKLSGIRKVAIDQAEFASDSFSSSGRMHVALDDGGVLLSTNDTQVFPMLMLTFQSGRFTIHFRRQGSAQTRGYAVNAGMPATLAAYGKFSACMTDMLARFVAAGHG